MGGSIYSLRWPPPTSSKDGQKTVQPDFLIVGAAKAGTTTLFDDLSLHPDICMPSDKEPDILHRCQDRDDALRMWRRHFSAAKPGDVRGEGSTFYTMTPEFAPVADLAAEALGETVKIVYMIREPISRIESHLAHDVAAGRITPGDADQAALSESRYVSWSDYGRQIKPWIKAFGREQVFIILFEDFVSHRFRIVSQVARFVGVDPSRLPEREEVSNSRENLRTMRSATISRLVTRTAYRQHVRRLIPSFIRQALHKLFSKPANISKVSLSNATKAELRQRLSHVADDLKALGVSVDRWQQ